MFIQFYSKFNKNYVQSALKLSTEQAFYVHTFSFVTGLLIIKLPKIIKTNSKIYYFTKNKYEYLILVGS